MSDVDVDDQSPSEDHRSGPSTGTRRVVGIITAVVVGAAAAAFAVITSGDDSVPSAGPSATDSPIQTTVQSTESPVPSSSSVPSSAPSTTSASASTTPTTPSTKPAVAAPAGWPTPAGSVPVPATIRVSGTLDGGMQRYQGTAALGDGGQGESQPPMFELADGATLENVILGAPAADGVHCRGTCVLRNVWWEDVGEDAATFKGGSASQVMTIDGGGARSAADKVFQHNGPGTMIIRNFRVENIGKLYRSCGNCDTQYERHVVVENVVVTVPAKSVVGINPNYGDTAELSGITIVGDPGRKIPICEQYRGVTDGEAAKLGSGPDDSCRYAPDGVTYR
ncbi:pectate lyase [Saccharothrix deserti]|uniref:pectate lyase n=1 Tax=Saccharothrix deserti TaxID=2593674 RepID=UPI00131B5881|nr:pectate lyase [Saccharothrix deserti]